MEYATGVEIKVGDLVLIENSKTEGVVHSVVQTDVEMHDWNVDEAGVLIKSAPFGLVFWPLSETEDPVVFKNRATSI
jgi:hypothetical protein